MTTQTPADNRQTPECGDPIVESVVGDLRDRSRVGQRKYGVTLARTDLSAVRWFEHLYHELLDAALYAKRLSCFTPQASTGREWERECEVWSTAAGSWCVCDEDPGKTTGHYLLPSGAWVDFTTWYATPHGEDGFASEAAARAALAQAPDPRTPQASPASDKGIYCPHCRGACRSDCPRPYRTPSAPPPASEAEQPKCTHGQEDCEACHGEGSINCPHGCEPRRSAPTAPTSAGAGSVSVPRGGQVRIDHKNGWSLWVQFDKDGGQVMVSGPQSPSLCIALTTNEMQQLRAALSAPSPSPARAGFTYPDEAVDKALDAYWGGTATDMDINRAMVALRESRVTP